MTMTLEEIVYTYVLSKGGATSKECEAYTGKTHQSISARINGLVQKGLLKASNIKRDHATVWVPGDGTPPERDWRRVTLNQVIKATDGFRLTKHGGVWMLRVGNDTHHCSSITSAMQRLAEYTK